MNNQVTYINDCNSPQCVGDCKTEIYMICEVCSLVHGDNSVKKCFYCDLCKAYICCKKCRFDLVNRAAAATIKAANKVTDFVKGKNEKAKTSNRRTK